MLTREEVHNAWLAVSDILMSTRQPELALQVRKFTNQKPEPLTEKEHMAAAVLRRVRAFRVLERSAQRWSESNDGDLCLKGSTERVHNESAHWKRSVPGMCRTQIGCAVIVPW